MDNASSFGQLSNSVHSEQPFMPPVWQQFLIRQSGGPPPLRQVRLQRCFAKSPDEAFYAEKTLKISEDGVTERASKDLPNIASRMSFRKSLVGPFLLSE